MAKVVLIGVIRQELLSGLRHQAQFDKLRGILDGYDYFDVTLADHDVAAECFNTCRAAGIAAGDIDDMLIRVTIYLTQDARLAENPGMIRLENSVSRPPDPSHPPVFRSGLRDGLLCQNPLGRNGLLPALRIGQRIVHGKAPHVGVPGEPRKETVLRQDRNDL